MSLAIVFPGQGSQSPAMQAALADEYSEVIDTYAQASERLGYDLWKLVQNGPPERLNETQVTQPALLTAGVAAWRAWVKAGGATPTGLAGHSLGEYTALVCANALNFEDAVELVQTRAQLMQAAVPLGSGAMAALLGLDNDTVIAACAEAAQGEVVEAVNFNAPGQVVIAGTKAAVERAIDAAKAAGARRALMLNVSVPSHCALMGTAAEQLALALAEVSISVPELHVLSNVDVAPYETAAEIRDGLTRQLHKPVRWVETIEKLIADGSDTIVECGPGKVLAGLTRRIDKTVAQGHLDTPDSLRAALALCLANNRSGRRENKTGESSNE